MVDIYVGASNTHWILHEKLLCHRSRFFRNIFYHKNKSGSKNHAYGLPDEDDEPFKLFVGWLYSERVPEPKEEKDLTALFDLYLMAEKWEIRQLILSTLSAIREYYHSTSTWPSLRRVQYIYANTPIESPIRQLLVSCVARMLVMGKDGVPRHWENALRMNGQMAVEIIRCVQTWRFEPEMVPDPREEAVEDMVDEAERKKEGMGLDGGVAEKDDDDYDDDKLDWGEAKTVSQDISRNHSQAGIPNGH